MIVPSLYVSALLIAWLFVFGITKWSLLPSDVTFAIFGIGIFGYVSDRLAIGIVGLEIDRQYIFFAELDATATVETIIQRLLSRQVRRNLNISPRREAIEHGFILKTRRGYPYNIVIRLEERPNGHTSIKIASYWKRRYYLQSPNYFSEYARRTLVYVIDVLANRIPPFQTQLVIDLTNQSTDPLIDYVVDDLEGLYARTQRLQTSDKVKIGIFIFVLLLTVILSFFGQNTQALILAGIDGLFAIIELFDLMRRER